MGIAGKLGKRGGTPEGIPEYFKALICHAEADPVGPQARWDVGCSTPNWVGAQGSAELTPSYLTLGFTALVPPECSSFPSSAVAGDGWQELTWKTWEMLGINNFKWEQFQARESTGVLH